MYGDGLLSIHNSAHQIRSDLIEVEVESMKVAIVKIEGWICKLPMLFNIRPLFPSTEQNQVSSLKGKNCIADFPC